MHDGGVAVAALDLDREVDRGVAPGTRQTGMHRHHLLGPEERVIVVDLDDASRDGVGDGDPDAARG